MTRRKQRNITRYCTQGTFTEEVAQRIVDAFKHPENLPQALAPIFIHKHDNSPCRKWSFHNQLLVAIAGSTDARGMKQWNKIGRKVKKGASAIWILAPCLKKVDKKNETGEEETKTIIYGFKSIPVFAFEDTEGVPLPTADADQENWLQELPLREVAESWGITIGTIDSGSAGALGYYRPSKSGTKAVMLGVKNLSTWAHELIHAADHRLFQLKGEKWQLEVVAELGGAILLQCVGQEHEADLGGAFGYISRYAEVQGKTTIQGCISVLDRTCKCVQHVLEAAEQLQQQSTLTS